jgi:hypothetical protein
MSTTVSVASSRVSKIARSVFTASGKRVSYCDFGDERESAFGADEQAEEIVAG